MDRQLKLLVGGICVILLLARSNAHAQDNDPSAPNVGTSDNQPESGSDARSIYADIPQFGGPISVGGQIAEDAATVPQWRLQGLQDHFDPWYRFKERLNDCQGLQFNIDESMFYQVATDSLGEHDAASGLVRVYGQWELLGRGSENPGLVVFKGENRHRIGTSITPFDLGFEAGSILPTGTFFSEFDFGVIQHNLLGRGEHEHYIPHSTNTITMIES